MKIFCVFFSTFFSFYPCFLGLIFLVIFLLTFQLKPPIGQLDSSVFYGRTPRYSEDGEFKALVPLGWILGVGFFSG